MLIIAASRKVEAKNVIDHLTSEDEIAKEKQKQRFENRAKASRVTSNTTTAGTSVADHNGTNGVNSSAASMSNAWATAPSQP